MRKTPWLAALAALGLSTHTAAAGSLDFGKIRDVLLAVQAFPLFGVLGVVPQSSTASIDAATAEADPTKLVTLAKTLRVRVVTRAANAGANLDMIALWPDDLHPTHLIACNEAGAGDPGVQRIRISDGTVETIIQGTEDCDPVRRTAWGTILVGEEGGERLIEIANPLATSDVQFDNATGAVGPGGVGVENVVVRDAVGRLAFEGLGLLPSGVLYYGDENRPSRGTAGGAYYKFIPTHPYAGGAPIESLDQSPLASGRVFGLRLGKRSGNTDYGQGTNTGLGTWIEIPGATGADLRAAAAANKLTGYYRPEDLEVDRGALAAGSVRVCGTNTGNEGNDKSWGEVVCLTDGTPDTALANSATPELQYLVVGNAELAMPDNVAYQPGRGNWVLHEDGDGPLVGRNNDLWDCLDDGGDADSLSDGCVRIATLNDLNAEWTGGVFDATGRRFFVSVQHNVTGHGVILEVTGWR